MRFVSHRGAAGLATENSLKAIQIGDSYQPEYIEVDIHRTRDGVFVLYHGNLRRTYLGTELEENYEDLKKKIPETLTLSEFIKKAPRRPYMIDIKIKTHDDDLIKALAPLPLAMRSLFTSPHAQTLFNIKKAFPDSRTLIAQPYTEGPIRPIELARKYGFSGISLNKWWLGPFTLKMCSYYGLDITVYTVDHPMTMKIITKLYPSVVVCTNRPDKFYEISAQKNSNSNLLS